VVNEHGLRILVVEDNADGARSLGLLLGCEGHQVRSVPNGPAALTEAVAFHPDMVLLDIGLPGGLDGYEVARRLRQLPGGAGLFLAALTGFAQEEDRRRSLAAGFDVHLVKPINLDGLRQLLGKVRQGAREPVMGNDIVRELTSKHCAPCEGGVPALPAEQVRKYLEGLPAWKLTADGKKIRREWRVQDFIVALDFFRRVGEVAEAEGHHPDLHLTGYRNVAIEMTTHAIDGLSENDFILAARIEQLPVALKK
jgi:4a-hydroxytetrahydrobiopterin dehydratase